MDVSITIHVTPRVVDGLGAVEEIKTAQKVELAHQLCRPHGPYSKSQVARALEIARGTLYLKGKQAVKDKAVATAIEQWHEQDDTMGHRKLAVLRKHGKNRVKRVMKKYGIEAVAKRNALPILARRAVVCPMPCAIHRHRQRRR